ncbi:unnamed protein product, partial [Onchocerca ochengi]
QPQPSESELDEYYRRQQAQETPQLSFSPSDDYYRQQQQQYIADAHQDGRDVPYYPDTSRYLYQEWNPWTTWSICPITCGDSVQTRQRTCRTGSYCYGETIQHRPCHFRPCGIRTEWSDWCECVD